MFDRFGRKINYLRISVTENCNLKCIYCTSHCDEKNTTPTGQLNLDNYDKIISILAELGIDRVRLTGGEPLLYQDICGIVKVISKNPKIKDISLTTNGVKLKDYAKDLKKFGLNRINISLDSLKRDRIIKLTGVDCLDRVISGIDEAIRIGFERVKINALLIRGINDDEIDEFILLTKDLPIDVRFIELMPMSGFGEENFDKVVFNDEIIRMRPDLLPIYDKQDTGPARYYTIPGHKGRVGFISPMSHKFCASCNRIRLTSDGKLRLCLGENTELDLIGFLNKSDKELKEVIENGIYNKPLCHTFEGGFVSDRKMMMIGG